MKKFLLVGGIVSGVIAVLVAIVGLSMWSWVGGFYDSANTTRKSAISRDLEAQLGSCNPHQLRNRVLGCGERHKP